MSKKEFEILIEKSNMQEGAENRIFSALDMLINLNDIYEKENNLQPAVQD